MGDHDALFKRIFAVPAHAAGELRSVLPPEVVEVIDLSRLELVSGESVSDHMQQRYADLLFRAPLREPGDDGQLIHLYVHVQLHVLAEHQSQPERLMPLRSVEYKLGLWRQLLREDPTRKTLPPVITLVVHHGPGGWTAPRSLHEMVEGLDRFPMLAPYVPDEQLLIDDLAFVDDAALRARPLLPVPKMAVWLLRDGRNVDALLAHIHAWKDVLTQVLREDPRTPLEILLTGIPKQTEPVSLTTLRAGTGQAGVLSRSALFSRARMGHVQDRPDAAQLQLYQVAYRAFAPLVNARDGLEDSPLTAGTRPSADASPAPTP